DGLLSLAGDRDLAEGQIDSRWELAVEQLDERSGDDDDVIEIQFVGQRVGEAELEPAVDVRGVGALPEAGRGDGGGDRQGVRRGRRERAGSAARRTRAGRGEYRAGEEHQTAPQARHGPERRWAAAPPQAFPGCRRA